MRVRISTGRDWLAAALLGATGLAAVEGWGAQGPQGRLAAAPAARSEALATNLPPGATRKDSLKQLEEQLSTSWNPFSTKSALDAVLAPTYEYRPPVRTVLPNRKSKAQLDKRSILMMSPDELGKLPTSEDWLNPSGDNRYTDARPRDNSLQAIYQDLERRKGGQAGPGKLGAKDPSDKRRGSAAPRQDEEDKVTVTGPLRDTEERLRKQASFGNDSLFNPNRSERGNLVDIFGTGIGREPDSFSFGGAKENPYLEQYRKLLNGPSGTAGNPLDTPLAGTDPARQATAYNPALNSLGASQRRDRPESTMGAINPSLDPNPLADVNARALNAWNPLYSAPPLTPPPRPTPPPLNFDAPRRKF